MRPLLAAAAFLAAGAATSSWAAAPSSAPNDIIWDTPPAKAGAPKETMTLPATGTAGQPDKNGIIWDTPAPPPAAKPGATPAASAAKPDANGITWNAPPVKSAPGRLLPTPTATPTADGPCREFQTTIVIDGKREPAHGTVCRQADGTWRVVNK